MITSSSSNNFYLVDFWIKLISALLHKHPQICKLSETKGLYPAQRRETYNNQAKKVTKN